MELQWIQMEKQLYVTNLGSSDVSVIDTGTNTVKSTVRIENRPCGVAITQNKKMHKWKLVL